MSTGFSATRTPKRGVIGAIKRGFVSVVNGAARGELGSIATQGIAVATGLQSKFDFAGVTVAGVIGGVGDAVTRGLARRNGLAGVKASAGPRSAVCQAET